MSAIDRADVSLELEDLQGILTDRPPKLSLRGRFGGFDAPRETTVATFPSIREVAASLPGSDRSPLAQFAIIFRDSFKTTAPMVIADLVGLAASGVIAQMVLRFLEPHSPIFFKPAAVVLALLIMAYWLCGLYTSFGTHPVLELRQLIQINSLGFLAAAVGGIVAPPLPLWCVGAWIISLAAVPFCRAFMRRWCSSQAWWGFPTLVISSGRNAEALTDVLFRAPTSGFRPVAMTDPNGNCRSSVMPVVNDPAELEALIRRRAIRYAVVSLPDHSSTSITEVFDRYSALIPHVVVMSDTTGLPSLWGTARSCGRWSGLEMRNGRMLTSLWIVKRVTDVVIASVVLCMSFPLLVAIAVAVKLTSRGPIFYGHSRIGFSGRWFMAWKFRTMHPDGDAVLRTYLEQNPACREEWEHHHKLRHDPRVTGIGRFLRKSSLDEFPQIWNVLKGEMSLVGPRPIVGKEVAKYGHVFKLYSAVKPGVTGLWQVSGRTDISYDERVRLDQYYIANWSPWLDIWILAKTAIVLLRRNNGAY
jgi:Undecaprenyl-phosphate galactose phosphotransferase WbaP